MIYISRDNSVCSWGEQTRRGQEESWERGQEALAAVQAKEAGAVIRVDGDVVGEATAGINACPIQGGNRI